MLEGERITKFRIAMLDWTGPQYMIARHLGVPPSRITDWQMGRREIPTKYLVALSRILKRNPEDLVGYADDDIYLIHPNEIVNNDPFYHPGVGRSAGPRNKTRRSTNGQTA